MEGDEMSQVRPACHKPMLIGSEHLLVLYVLHDGPQDDLLHKLLWHHGQTDRSVVYMILLLALF